MVRTGVARIGSMLETGALANAATPIKKLTAAPMDRLAILAFMVCVLALNPVFDPSTTIPPRVELCGVAPDNAAVRSLFPMASSGDLLADRRYAWAQAAMKDGDLAGAADLLAQTLERAPDWPPALAALGDMLRARGDRAGAQQAYEKAALHDAGEGVGARLKLAALGAAPAPATAPEAYVRALFDDYAPRFEAHLTQALAYRGPELITKALAQAEEAAGRHWARVIDLGCGTGLMAEAIRADAEFIVGLDIAPRMVDAARRKGVYDALHVGEAAAFLGSEPAASADAVLAADVFVYVGDLAAIFREAARVLAPGGRFAFTLQLQTAQDWALGEDLRYAHSPGYIHRLAAEHDFRVAVLEEASKRKDAGVDVPGLVAALVRA
jgi:predicted TPR repeat methyltransferase